MPRAFLLEYFRQNSRPSDEIGVVWRSGYRTMCWPYEELFRAATRFAWELRERGIDATRRRGNSARPPEASGGTRRKRQMMVVAASGNRGRVPRNTPSACRFLRYN
jgi:hypothetical protein